jgi:hypothetical protein
MQIKKLFSESVYRDDSIQKRIKTVVRAIYLKPKEIKVYRDIFGLYREIDTFNLSQDCYMIFHWRVRTKSTLYIPDVEIDTILSETREFLDPEYFHYLYYINDRISNREQIVLKRSDLNRFYAFF